MKKLYLILTAIFLLCLSCNNVTAQVPYKASVGGVLPSLFAGGPSSKFFFKEHIAFQADILLKTVLTAGRDADINKPIFAVYIDLEANLNIVYQNKFKEKEYSEYFWLIGGGVSYGYDFAGFVGGGKRGGKIGVNTIFGIEIVNKATPVSFQIDFRPGYGMLFTFNNSWVDATFLSHKSPWSHFDWMIGFTLRYTFKKK